MLQDDGTYKRDWEREEERRSTTIAEREERYEIEHPDEETGEPKRRDSRGPGSWGSCRACNELFGRAGTDLVSREKYEASKCAEHVMRIAVSDPNGSDFTFVTASPPLSTASVPRAPPQLSTAQRLSFTVAPADVPKHDACAQRYCSHFGPPALLSSLPDRRLTTSTHVYLTAVGNGDLIKKVDAESHREDDPNGRWKAGDVYDFAVTLEDPRSGSTVAVLFHKRRRYSKLDGVDKAGAVAALRSFPDALTTAYGHGPEWKWAIEPAGLRKADGSDGIDVKEVVLQVMPRSRRGPSQQGEQRWSMSQNLWVPVMGLRRTAYHMALPDCITEAIVCSALGRALARPAAMGGCM